VAAIASGGATDLIEPTNNTLHALALLTDGRVLAWGENVAGKLGTGNQQGSAVPVQVRAVGGAVGSALSGVTAIAANQNSSYAISNGNVLAWGGNSSGQLGDGTLANRFSPIVVRACKNGNTFLGVTAAANCTALGGVLTDLTEVEALSTGGVTNLALMKDGGVLAWGANQATQLGDGTATAAKRTPVSVLCGAAGSPGTEFCDDANRLRGVVEVASGIGDSYARLSNGQVLAWGGNASGQLGDGSVFNIRTTPIQPPGLDGPASAVAAGGGFSLVLHVSQMLSSWGFVTSGQLGVGSTIPSISPVRVRDVGGAAGSAFTGATTVVAGASTSYTIKDARPFAWGAGGSGQIGDGAGGNRLAPVAVHCGALAADPVFCPGGVLTGVTAISAASGSLHVIALLSDGRVISWGANTIFGRLGDGTTVGIRTSPVEVVCGEMAGTPFCSPNGKLQGAKAVSTGTINSYAILTDGTALAWGGGTTGALGNGALAHVSSPVRVGCGEMAGISAFCGEDGKLKGVTAIAGGANYAVALLSDSSLVSWGLNDAGQLGNGTTTDAILPVRVKGPDGAGDLVGVTAIDAGISTTYALQSGNVLAWGVGGSGQLGHGRVTSSPLPIRVKSCRAPDGTFTGESKEFCIAPNVFEDLDSVTAVSGGGNYALAVRSDGNVLAWGGNSTNQLAIPLDSARPLPGFVKLDLTAPAVTINSPTPGALARGAIEIAATATDLSTVTWFACSAEGVALGTSSEGSFSAQLNTLTIPDGPRAIACEAADPSGNIGSATRNITVDNTPPTAAISLSRSTLWPPNGKLAPVTIVVTVQDNIALSSGALIRSFTIVSNEPDDSLGTMGDVNGMDGHSGPVDVTAQSVAYSSDFKSATVSATVQLRAERLAILHDGRAYSISVEVADAAGNVAAAPGAAVTVPLNQAP
jgi:alpha-tubulin suppressor-like RCC1 family protein